MAGGSDGGAHCGLICDASMPTTNLSHWARDRSAGNKIPLELIIRKQTKDTAETYGLFDRGEIKTGMIADINIIDFEKLNNLNVEDAKEEKELVAKAVRGEDHQNELLEGTWKTQ